MIIKRDWAGRPTSISTEKGQVVNFVLLFKDESGIWNRIENLDTLDLPAVRGWLDILLRDYETRYIDNEKRKKELKKRLIQTPRDRWDKLKSDEDKYKKHPYDYTVAKKDEKDIIKEEK